MFSSIVKLVESLPVVPIPLKAWEIIELPGISAVEQLEAYSRSLYERLSQVKGQTS